MDDLRVQIVNYKTKDYLAECLETLFRSLAAQPVTHSVSVLDNASGDDLGDLPSLFSGRPLHVHHGQINAGFGAGHNALARLGTARYLWLLNPDTKVLEPGTPQRLMRRAIELGAAVIGPRLMSATGSPQAWDHGELDGWLARAALATGNSYWRPQTRPCAAAWVSGAALLIETTWFEKMGGFDERFFLYKEEEELCWRLRAAGGRVIHDPTVSVFHHCGVVASKATHLRASTDYFLEKHFRHRAGYPVYRLINALLH